MKRNRERNRLNQRAWREDNSDKVKALHRAYYQRRKWINKHKATVEKLKSFEG